MGLSHFLLSLALLSLSLSQDLSSCPDCSRVSSLLASCALPPLSVPKPTDVPPYRNVSGATSFAGHGDQLPAAYYLETYADAACLCLPGIEAVHDCQGCLSLKTDAGWVAQAYNEDCNAFGYWANVTQGAPTTTRSAVPVRTSVSSSVASAIAPCAPWCSIIAEQTDECRLMALDYKNYYSKVTNVGGRYESIYRHLLFNRTAGECLCTLPVNRQMFACRDCLYDQKQTNAAEIVDDYWFDCAALGYFSDSQQAVYPKCLGCPSGLPGSELLSTSSSSSASATRTAPPTTGTGSNHGNTMRCKARNNLWVIVAGIVLLQQIT
jgi:hypothetical protein